jgi:hypothetical protein
LSRGNDESALHVWCPQSAIALLKPIKDRYPEISYADLFQMASAAAIDVSGGPKIDMLYGKLPNSVASLTELGVWFKNFCTDSYPTILNIKLFSYCSRQELRNLRNDVSNSDAKEVLQSRLVQRLTPSFRIDYYLASFFPSFLPSLLQF